MKWKISLLLLGALSSISANAADMSALLTSAEATADSGDSDTISTSQSAESPSSESLSLGSSGGSLGGVATGTSRTSNAPRLDTRSGQVAVSDFSLLMGPSLNQFSTNAPSAAQPYSGFSARHVLRADYSLSHDVVVGPSFDVTQNMYSAKQGTFVFNDPSMRLEFNNLNQARFGKERYSGSVWLAAYAPVSTRSENMHEYTALSVAYIPKLTIRGSRLFFTGVGSVRASFMNNSSQTGMIAPIQFVTSAQVNYRLTPSETLFVMDHVNTNCGPQMAFLSNDLGAESFRRRAIAGSAVTNGIMTGAQFRVSAGISISPRLDWVTSQPITGTTVGLNALFSLI